MTKQKIIRLELYLLFFFTFFSFLYFYYQDVFPDSFLSISSDNKNFNFLFYYISSFVALIGFYSGIWIFFPFFSLSLSYAFLFNKRKFKVDSLAFFSFAFFYLSFSHVFFPTLIGGGLLSWMDNRFHVVASFFLSIVFFNTSMLVCYREKYIKFLSAFYQNVQTLFQKTQPVVTRNLNLVENKVIETYPKVKSAALMLAQKCSQVWQPKESTEEPSDVITMEPVASRSQMMEGLREPLKERKVAPVELDDEMEELSHGDEEISLADDDEDNDPEGLDEDDVETEVAKVIHVQEKNTRSRFVKEGAENSPFESAELIDSIAAQRGNKVNNQPEHFYFDEIIRRLEEKMTEFKVDAKVINILKGPVVDTFEIELGSGVKVSRMTSIQDDLSLALQGVPIRMVYPMKGRTTVGIEIPRNPREVIYLEDVLKAKLFTDTKARLPIAMGKTSLGEVAIVDLASMPHMLVAGSTGAGKSVFINTLLVSLLVKMSPEKMKLVLIDPKQLELALYANLPHLLLPVITEPKNVNLALAWACEEMERRYSILKEIGVRNIDGFNEKLKHTSEEVLEKISKHYSDQDEEYELPYVVIIVDEFADLVLSRFGKEIENSIARLAAKARAAGIHIVLATQRPSVDVITGVIKNNFPSRVAFKVQSGNDSRTILNSQGAENLLGKGDMLFSYSSELQRLHSAYVDENEIEALVEKLGKIPVKFSQKAQDFIERGGFGDDSGTTTGLRDAHEKDDDPLFNDAVKAVFEHRQKGASASMLQRRLGVGYNRAANLIEDMEKRGIVGPGSGSKPRQVLPEIEHFLEGN
ncbi:MAG: DNA translocase FtsK [Bacteriovoracaceae bacterium]